MKKWNCGNVANVKMLPIPMPISNWKLATLVLATLAILATFANSAFAGNAVNPDAIELAPLPMPVEFKSDMDSPVPFDSQTVVSVDCPDKSAAAWLAAHFAEWYGVDAPKVAANVANVDVKS